MIKARIQIGEGVIQDTFDAFGLVYLSSDNVFEAKTKGFATTSYAEQEGENVDPRTVDDAFDYKIRFLVEAKNYNKTNANEVIAKFNKALYSQDKTDIKTFKTITFYNDYKRVKIVGIPQPIDSVSEDDFFRDKFGNVHDAVVIELTIRVNKPSLCDFSTLTPINTNGQEYVDMGEAGLWATNNIGATPDDPVGLFFGWGEVIGKQADAYNPQDYKFGNITTPTKYNKEDGLTTLLPIDDAANFHMGGDWQIPTPEAFRKLRELCDSWVDLYYYDVQVPALIFALKTNPQKQIAFPVHDSIGWNYDGGGYWENQLMADYGIQYAQALWIDKEEAQGYFLARNVGLNIRGYIPPIKD